MSTGSLAWRHKAIGAGVPSVLFSLDVGSKPSLASVDQVPMVGAGLSPAGWAQS